MWISRRAVWALSCPFICMWLAVPALAERPKAAETAAACSSFMDARKVVGQKSCIRGQVLRVENSADGESYLDFCDDPRKCPFTVVVFTEDRRHVGSLEPLVGRIIEIRGKVRDYDGQAEIVLQDSQQLGEGFRKLPPVPKEFDVEQRGKFSPGTFHATKSRKASRKKAKLPTTIDVEDGFDD